MKRKFKKTEYVRAEEDEEVPNPVTSPEKFANYMKRMKSRLPKFNK